MMEYVLENCEEKWDNAIKTAFEDNTITPIVKMELASKVRQRRLESGKGDIDYSFHPPVTYELTADEKMKVERRKHRNRLSANQARIKRKSQLENLESDVEKYEDEQRALRTEIQNLKAKATKYKTILYLHRLSGGTTCRFEQRNISNTSLTDT